MSLKVPPEGGKQDAPSGVNDSSPTGKDTGALLWPSLFPLPDRARPQDLPSSLVTSATELKPEQTAVKAADQGPKCPNNVKCDAGGYATDIDYPGGKKSRHIERDKMSHEAISVTTKTSDATTTLLNKDGRWLLSMQGVQLPVNGNLEVSKDGEVAIKTRGSNAWKVERTDGTVADEKENADGARVRLDASGQAIKVLRADGSSAEKINDNTIMESHPGQKPVTWSKEAESWKSDSGQLPRKNLKISDDGKLSFTDGSGVKHNIDGRNLETMEANGLAKITTDKQNRPSVVDTGDKIRKYEYFGDNSNDVKSVDITNKKTGQNETHSRDSKDSDQWTNTSWRGEITVGQDGVHSVRTHPNGQAVSDSSRWDSYHPDGRISADTIGKDGSRLSYERGTNNLTSLRLSDGIRIDRFDEKGQSSIKYYNPRLGDTVTWTKGEDGKYRSDSSIFKDARSNLDFNANGELSYLSDKGEKVSESVDGNKRVGQPDGTILEYGADNKVSKAIRGQIERSFKRENGDIKSVVDRDSKTNKETPVFDAGARGSLSHIHLAENGDLSYQNADASAVVEKANGLRLELDKDGDLSSVRSDAGSRSFRYLREGENKALVGVIDQTKTEKGELSESFTRVINPDGKLAREFRSDKASPSRFDITVCAGGDYEYAVPGAKQVQTARMSR